MRFFLTLLALIVSSAPAYASRGGSELSDKTVLVGVNVSGLEQGALPGTPSTDYPIPNSGNFDYYRSKNWMRVRVPFRWERIQPVLNGPLDPTFVGYLTSVASTAAAHGQKILLDVHNYGGYTRVGKVTGTTSLTTPTVITGSDTTNIAVGNGISGTGIPGNTTVISVDTPTQFTISNAATAAGTVSLTYSYPTHKLGDGTLNPSDFADLWSRIAAVFVGNPAVYGYDLMNEPSNMPTANAWHDAAQAAINAIRAIDSTTPIYVEGNGYSGTYSWFSNGNADLANLTGGNLVFSGHAYADHDNSGTNGAGVNGYDNEVAIGDSLDCAGGAGHCAVLGPDILVKRYKPFIEQFCEPNHLKCHIGESGVPNSDPRWLTILDNGLAYLQKHNVPITYFAAGPYFGKYFQGVENQASGGDTVQVAVLTKYTNAYQPRAYYLTGPSRGTVGTPATFTVTYKGCVKSASDSFPSSCVVGPITVTPTPITGVTFSPSSVTLSPGFNPTATFTATASGSSTYIIATKNSIGWTDPAAVGFATQPDLFMNLATATPQNIFSFRKLYAPYIGPCCTFRRESDNKQMTVGFTSQAINAPVDTASLLTWAAGSPVHLVTWYDQGPNAYNAGIKRSADGYGDGQAPTLADQPVFSATDANLNNKPGLVWNGSNGMDAISPINGYTNLTVLAAFNPASLTANRVIGWDFLQHYAFPNGGNFYMDGDNFIVAYMDEGYFHTYGWRYKIGQTNGMTAYRDGYPVQQSDSNAALSSINLQYRFTARLGYPINASGSFQGDTAETLVFKGALTDSEMLAFSNDQANYYGTPTPTAPALPTAPAIDTTTPSALPLTGVNNSEMEFGAYPGVFHTDYFDHSSQNCPYYHSRSLLTIREPFKWERLQPTLQAPLDATKLAEMRAAVDTCQAAGENILLDMHNYAQYGDSMINAPTLEKVVNGTFIAGASFTGSIAGTTLTVSALSSGTLAIGQVINGPGVTAGTKINSLGTGTGGTGTYILSASQAVASTSLTSTENYATFTGSISGKVLTVTAISSGKILNGQMITGQGVTENTTISSLGTGTGGVGTYNINNSQTVMSEYMSGAQTTWNRGQGVTVSGNAANMSNFTGIAISETPSTANGMLYTVTYTLSNVTSGSVTLKLGTGSGTTRSSNGTFTEQVRCGPVPSDIIAFSASGFSGSISNVSVQFISAKPADYADFWRRMADAFPSSSYPKVSFDLMNEPHAIDGATMASFYNAAIPAIRGEGFTGWILIEGLSYASTANWIADGWAAAALTVTDTLNKLIDEGHAYLDAGADGGGSDMSFCTRDGVSQISAMTDWATTNNRKLLLGEFGISPDNSCMAQYGAMLDYMASHDVWVGFTAWTDGAYKNDYPYKTGPASFTAPLVDRPNLFPLINHRNL
ncbi:glycoside hydrolase family 5 protein [Roseicella sp. DB1501]|uniref:glycoside hydrolase family 5 protein n=1 Tax=Roseicella sp. DB1501 TaxID=2730925 RepID=UPI0014918BBC|nr:cellulase family glycosylhydrolase [Roseicella sp. DB1501]NOG70504.1 cellulase family glycosylhydrolase [Roseicella sp. DB1501]